jgi:hypothetical protein
MSVTPPDQSVRSEPTVVPPAEPQTRGFGLLAIGSSRGWDVAVNESLELPGEWLLELDGPTIYLVFQLRDLGVIGDTVGFLQQGLGAPRDTDRRPRLKGDGALSLGTFGKSGVWLLWDDESPLRCFLLITAGEKSSLRLTLWQDDVEMLLEALRQVAKDLPEEAK